jgi:hypothetical protein
METAVTPAYSVVMDIDILTPPQTVKINSPALKNKKIATALIAGGLALFFIMWFSVATQSLFYVWDELLNEAFKQLRQNAPAQATQGARMLGKAGSQGITAVTIPHYLGPSSSVPLFLADVCLCSRH